MERPDQLPHADLNWGQIRRPRWRMIAVIAALHIIVISAVVYFNSSIRIPTLPTFFVDVLSGEAPPSAPAQAPQTP